MCFLQPIPATDSSHLHRGITTAGKLGQCLLWFCRGREGRWKPPKSIMQTFSSSPYPPFVIPKQTRAAPLDFYPVSLSCSHQNRQGFVCVQVFSFPIFKVSLVCKQQIICFFGQDFIALIKLKVWNFLQQMNKGRKKKIRILYQSSETFTYFRNFLSLNYIKEWGGGKEGEKSCGIFFSPFK